MLAQDTTAEISLREISRRVGLVVQGATQLMHTHGHYRQHRQARRHARGGLETPVFFAAAFFLDEVIDLDQPAAAVPIASGMIQPRIRASNAADRMIAGTTDWVR